MVNLKKIINFFFQSNVIRASIMRWRKRAFFPSCYFFDVVTLLLSFSLYSFLFKKKKILCVRLFIPLPPPAGVPPRERKNDAGRLEIDRAETCYFSDLTSAEMRGKRKKQNTLPTTRKTSFGWMNALVKKKRKLTGKKKQLFKKFSSQKGNITRLLFFFFVQVMAQIVERTGGERERGVEQCGPRKEEKKN